MTLFMSAEDNERRRATFIAWMEANGLNVNRVAKLASVKPTTLYSYHSGDSKTLSRDQELRIARAFDLPEEAIFGPVDLQTREPNHVRAWRERAKLSVERLAEIIGTTPAILTMLEDGEITLSNKWLRRLEEPLGVRGGAIRDFDPAEVDAEVMLIFQQSSSAEKARMVRILRASQDAAPAAEPDAEAAEQDLPRRSGLAS